MAARLDELVEGGHDIDGELIVAIAEIDAEAAAKSNQCMFLMPPFFCLPPILLCNLCCGCYFCSLNELRGTKAWLTPKFLKIDKDWALTKTSVRIPLEKIQNVDLRQGCVCFCFCFISSCFRHQRLTPPSQMHRRAVWCHKHLRADCRKF